MITITGAKGIIPDIEYALKITNSYADEHKITIQLMDANMVYGKQHLQSAVDNALRSFERDDSISSTLAMEILLYASGEYQIRNALEKMGLKSAEVEQQIAMVLVADQDPDQLVQELFSKLDLVQDDSVLDGDVEVLKRFGITDAEIDAILPKKVGDLILERVAMVDIKKK
jgi:KEOPS complex subunit Cgi121